MCSYFFNFLSFDVFQQEQKYRFGDPQNYYAIVDANKSNRIPRWVEPNNLQSKSCCVNQICWSLSHCDLGNRFNSQITVCSLRFLRCLLSRWSWCNRGLNKSSFGIAMNFEFSSFEEISNCTPALRNIQYRKEGILVVHPVMIQTWGRRESHRLRCGQNKTDGGDSDLSVVRDD